MAESFGAVAPEVRRRRIGSALYLATRARLAAECADDPRPGPRELRSYALETETADRGLLAEHGYVPIRYGFEMRRHLTGALPDHPLPAGLEMRPVTEDQHRAIFDADNEAFEDHWGHRPPEEADFQARFHGPDMDPGDLVRGLGRRPGGGRRHERDLPGRERGARDPAGWLEHVSVRRPWRGRGVAKALCAASFRVLREQGIDEAWLGVDGTNPTGALQLYEGLGFGAVRRWAAYGRPLDRPAPVGWQPGRRGRPSLEREAALVPDQLHPWPLAPDRRPRAVAREHSQPILERAQPRDRRHHRLGIAAREVDAAPAAGEQRVAAEQQAVVRAEQADGALGVAGVCRTRRRISPNRISPPSASSTAGTEGMTSKGAYSGFGVISRWASSGWIAMSAPVWACTAALSPMWSQ